MSSCTRRAAFAVLAGTAQLFLTGCFAVTQAYHEVVGAQAELKLNESVASEALRQYRDLRVAPATALLSTRLTPSAVRTAWDHAAGRMKGDLAEGFPGEPPVLEIQTELLYFQEKGLLSPAELLARVTMRGEDRVVVDALVKAESKSFRAGDEEALANAAIKQLERFVREQKGLSGEDKHRRDKERESEKRTE